MSVFIDRLKVTSATSKKSEFPVVTDEMKLIHRVHTDRKVLNRLNDYLVSMADFCQENRPNLTVSIRGRIKSIKRAKDNLVKKHKNIDDLIGFKIIVDELKSAYIPEDELRKAIKVLSSIRKKSKEITEFIKCLTVILNKREEASNKPSCKFPNYIWSEFFKSEPEEHRIHSYKNPDVLFVDRLSKIIDSLNKSNFTHKPTIDKVISHIRQAQNATTYGASIELANYIRNNFTQWFGNCSVVENRSKSVLKENGYAAEHFTLRDDKLNISIEVQCKSSDNEEIAKFGAAAHQAQKGKIRFLHKLPQCNNIPIRNTRETLLTIFSNTFIQSILKTLPKYSSAVTTKNGTSTCHTYTGWENFCYYYQDELQKMTVKEKEYYEVFLSIDPYFDNERDNSKIEFPFDTVTLNIIQEERKRRQKQKSVMLTPSYDYYI